VLNYYWEPVQVQKYIIYSWSFTLTILSFSLCIDINSGTLADNSTPLHFAAMSGDENTVKKMLDKGANISASVTEGDTLGTPLHWAAEAGHEKVISITD